MTTNTNAHVLPKTKKIEVGFRKPVSFFPTLNYLRPTHRVTPGKIVGVTIPMAAARMLNPG